MLPSTVWASNRSRPSATTYFRSELSENKTPVTVANDLAVHHALEAAGVIFIDENGSAALGVRPSMARTTPGLAVEPLYLHLLDREQFASPR